MPIFAGASRGAVVRMRCPKCGEVQARARIPAGTTYTCRACHKTFTAAEGQDPPEAASPRRPRKR